jgi:phosphoribosyl-ATP pyrophosphohydrolase
VSEPRDARVLDALYQTIQERRQADPGSSYTAKLLAKGDAKIAQKVGEEAVETVIEAMRDDPDALAAESADLLYHLLVLWAVKDVSPEEVWEKLLQRKGTSGIAEKLARQE